MGREQRRNLLFSTACLTIAGCATVHPRPDYDRAAEHIAHATGQAEVYRPDDDAAVAARVTAILEAGITVDEAAQLALLNNPSLQASFLNIGVAHADFVQSKLFSNPSLFTSFRLPDGGGLSNIELTLAQNIADLWQIPVRKRAAEASLYQTIQLIAREAGVLAADAKAAYFRAAAADRQRTIAQENLAIAQQLLDVSLARQQAGAGSEVDVNLARSELLDRELAARAAELAALEARQELTVRLGLTLPLVELALTDPLPEPILLDLSVDELIAVAQVERIDVEAARNTVVAAEARWKEQRRRIFPTVEVGVAMEREERARGTDRNLLAETARASLDAGQLALPSLDPRGGQGQNVKIGPSIGLELPIFDQNQAQIARAEFILRQAEKLLDALIRLVTQEARIVFERARIARDVAGDYKDRVLPLRQANLNLSREAYRAGKLSFLSVLEAQRTLLEARSKYIDTLRDAALANTDVERVTGRPLSAVLAREQRPPDVPSEGTERGRSNTP
jgi:cobalt-zinc-cadmium efflux system outer membrane protein